MDQELIYYTNQICLAMMDGEVGLANSWGWQRLADQAPLSRPLDALTRMNIDELRTAINAIQGSISRIQKHDWPGFLLLDFDWSGLPCSAKAEASQKGYFSGKKTSLDAS